MKLVYRIDHDDRISFVSDAWDAFAVANGGERIKAEHVLGRCVWDFVTDRTTLELYRYIVKRARAGHAIRFSFRCDSPDRRRLLEMQVRSAGGASVEFRTETLLEETREPMPVAAAGADGASPGAPQQSAEDREGYSPGSERLRVCSWCKMVATGTGWVEVEEAVDALRLFDRIRVPLVTHGICDRCHKKMSEVIAQN